jgi:hypothetical protein
LNIRRNQHSQSPITVPRSRVPELIGLKSSFSSSSSMVNVLWVSCTNHLLDSPTPPLSLSLAPKCWRFTPSDDPQRPHCRYSSADGASGRRLLQTLSRCWRSASIAHVHIGVGDSARGRTIHKGRACFHCVSGDVSGGHVVSQTQLGWGVESAHCVAHDRLRLRGLTDASHSPVRLCADKGLVVQMRLDMTTDCALAREMPLATVNQTLEPLDRLARSRSFHSEECGVQAIDEILW